MKITLEFDTDIDGQSAALAAIHGSTAFCVIWELDQHLRSISKHGNNEARAEFADEIRGKITDIMSSFGISHDMLE